MEGHKNLFAGVDLKERYPLRPIEVERETEGCRAVSACSVATGVFGVLLGVGLFLVITGIEAAALVAAVHWWGLWETCLVVLLGAGDDRVKESFYVLPPGPVVDFDRVRALVGAQMMLGFCDREYTPLVIDTGAPVVDSGEASVVRERVAEGLSRAGARPLVFNHGNGVR